MGRRLTRKQIKQDEFITLMDRAVHWLTANWRQAALGLGGALALGLLWWGFTLILGSRTAAATKALDEAVQILEAPVGAEAPPEAKLKFSTVSEQQEAAAKQLAKVRKYWFTPQARMARVLQARLALERGDAETALRELAAVAASGGTDPAARMATLDWVRLRLSRGDVDGVVRDLERMAAGKDQRLPRDLAMFELAKAYERAGKYSQAQEVLRKLVENFPDSPFRVDAQQKLSSLS
ncbi:MAG: tetratricopeptide repeat protein [Thermoanaerobaculum sp.]|nr:tetratricopeptide repeat protein [Thermoanaerobaculum sp.]MCX7896066.1 tetratricopeptide repeat protein [Thermoanaerobaculum sp.]MDW7967986.1 tetratricopeptide repeat protein [Thermoanaerobaculum sp.]